jgi:hypothetical protein
VVRASEDAGSDSVHRVLATLNCGENSYRVVGDLLVHADATELRLFRFDVPNADEWFAERKILIPVSHPEIAPLKQNIRGVEFQLCEPLALDETTAAAVFGAAGPPAT